MINAQKLKVERTAHYYTIGRPTIKTRYLWIVCHGYGQSAKGFLKSFTPIEAEDNWIIAPEGLSRFYWGGFTGPVVSSWMTKGDRLDEIDDYAKYLSQLYNLALSQVPEHVKVILLGFSQGVATQFRWIMDQFIPFNHLVAWSGMIPEDIDYTPHQAYLSDKHLSFIYGTDDPFLTADRLQMQRDIISSQQLEVETKTFIGKHEMNDEALRQLDQWFRAL